MFFENLIIRYLNTISILTIKLFYLIIRYVIIFNKLRTGKNSISKIYKERFVMANTILKTIIDEKVSIFINSFSNTSEKLFLGQDDKLIHPGEFGIYRERICKELLKAFIPSNLKISDGFIISSDESVSTQCDLIVYDPTKTPLIEVGYNRFFPIECVNAVFEIKSNLDKSKLKESLIKLSNIKRIRKCYCDKEAGDKKNIFTALICNSFTFNSDNLCEWLDKSVYDNINKEHRHNMVLSIHDGAFGYSIEKCYETFNNMDFNYSYKSLCETFFEFPINLGCYLNSQVINANEDNRHIISFLSNLRSVGQIETTMAEIPIYLGFDMLNESKDNKNI